MLKMKHWSVILLLLLLTGALEAQEATTKFTKEHILKMTTEELSALSLEELMAAVDIVGVSSLEELYDLILNKDVVSASKKAENHFDSPLSTTVLRYEEILASGASSIEEALRLVPGLIVREKTNGNFDVHIRGLDNLPSKNMMLYSENTSTLVMIDGRPVFNYAMGGILWETLPVTLGDIDRIEVVRGPASALYGPNAVSGAINIITKSITNESPLFTGNAQVGSMNTYMGEAAYRKKLNDKIGLGVSTNYEHRNRTNDNIYVIKEKRSVSKQEYESLTFNDGAYKYLDPKVNINEVFPDPGLSRERYAFNGFLDYTISDQILLQLKTGYQDSKVISSTLGDNPTVHSGRESSTSYFDFTGSGHGLLLQSNYVFGTQDYNKGGAGFKVDMGQFNALAEYDWQINNLTVRPGFNYISVFYDDTPYLKNEGEGFFKGRKEMSLFAGNVRLDYLAYDKLRFVAALRSEKYSHKSSWKSSWQFVASYKINANNNIRLVYSRANKSPFLLETETNFLWDRDGRPAPNHMLFKGNKGMDVVTMDMFEVGYRSRLLKNLLLDVEAYYSKGENYTLMSPGRTQIEVPVSMVDMNPKPVGNPNVTTYMNYQNSPLESTQVGLTFNLDWIISDKLIAKSHLTLQQTKLDHFNTVTRDEIVGAQAALLTDLLNQQIGQLAVNGQIPAYPENTTAYVSSDIQPVKYESDYEHKATPSYYGNIGLDYRPVDKFNVFTNCYFYGEQTFLNQYDTYHIKAKCLLNIKATYHLSPRLSFYVNGRNLLNMKSTEFAFMDEIPAMLLGGLQIKL